MPNSAALPGRRNQGAAPPDQFHEHPGQALTLVCPGCHLPDHLQLIVPAECYHSITAVHITEGGITYPQVEVTEWEASDPKIEHEQKAVGVRCTSCRWSYRGPEPTRRLVLL